MTVLVWITRITVPTPVRICPAILSMDNPDSRNRSTSPRPKMRFGRPMALQIFVLPGARRARRNRPGRREAERGCPVTTTGQRAPWRGCWPQAPWRG